MIRILLLLGFIFYSLPSLADVVYAKGSVMHGEEISTKDGCKSAREKAELDALQKGLGVTISSENLKKCSQMDGKSNCEHNQFSLITFSCQLRRCCIRRKRISSLNCRYRYSFF